MLLSAMSTLVLRRFCSLQVSCPPEIPGLHSTRSAWLASPVKGESPNTFNFSQIHKVGCHWIHRGHVPLPHSIAMAREVGCSMGYGQGLGHLPTPETEGGSQPHAHQGTGTGSRGRGYRVGKEALGAHPRSVTEEEDEEKHAGRAGAVRRRAFPTRGNSLCWAGVRADSLAQPEAQASVGGECATWPQKGTGAWEPCSEV